MKRTYATLAQMNEIAKSQWKAFAVTNGATDIDKWSDDRLTVYANAVITDADEEGDFWIMDGSNDGNGRPRFTMEMESWARGTTDGIECEIEILEWNTIATTVPVSGMLRIGNKEIWLDPHMVDALMYALSDAPEIYVDTDKDDYDTKEEYERVVGYGNALKELYNEIVEVME